MVTMENQRFRLVICPELGGRILSIVDREAGGELLFQPPMILSRTIGLAGAWHVGGLEINAFRYGHLVQGNSTLRTRLVQLACGVQAVAFTAFDERAECSFTCTIALLRDRVALRIVLENHSKVAQNGYYWTNIAVPAHPWFHILLPPGPILNHGAGRPGFTDSPWPIIDGMDCRRWMMHHQVLSAYAYAPEGDWMGGSDLRNGRTIVHRALRRDCAGRKLWSLGSADQDRIWFDNGVGEPAMGSYVELQSGRCSTQTHADLLPAGSRTEWTEEIFGMNHVPAGGDPRREYTKFKQAATRSLDAAVPVRSRDFWRVVGAGHTLVEADERQSLSERIVTGPEMVTAADARQVLTRGWVGGACWIQRLEQLLQEQGEDPLLSLGASVARIDLHGVSDPGLRSLAARPDAVGAWAAYVESLCLDTERALPLLRRAHAIVPEARVIAAAYAQRCLDARLLSTAGGVATRGCLQGTEEARAILAEIDFLESRWARVRVHLEAPFQSYGEGQMRLWLMRKEVDVVEAMEAFHQRRDAGAALELLHEAARTRPQFGIGRDESMWWGDVAFYRWAVMALSGQTEAARLACTQLLRYPAAQVPTAIGTSVGAYALRMAMLVGAPQARRWGGECARWHAEIRRDQGKSVARRGRLTWFEDPLAPGQWPAHLQDEAALRSCVLRAAAGRAGAFNPLQASRLFGHRAQMEGWLQPALQGLARKGRLKQSHIPSLCV
jgi:hypothetical protein